MGRIFISYSRRDTQTVDRIADAMCCVGLEVWIDRQDIQAGNTWRVQIVQAIDTCDAFVLMLSPNSVASDNVRKEIDLAQDSGRAIFAIMLEPVKLPAEIRYQLAGLQFIDVQLLGFDKAVGRLAGILREHVAKLKPVEEQWTCQAELVVQGVDLKSFSAEMGEQLLNFVAQLTHASRSGLTIANMAAGSVHVFMDMPARSAFELKTLALNRDKRFKKFGIASLRLAGDAKFINISLGILTAAATIGFLQAIWLSTPSLLVPVIGVTAGKILALSLVVTVTAGLALSAPKVIAPLLSPPPTSALTQTFIPISAPGSKPTLDSILAETPTLPLFPTKASTPTFIQTEAATRTATSLPTATPQNQLVLNDTLCWSGPGDRYEVVGALRKGQRVELTGRACNGGWWIVFHPRFHTDCWVMEKDLQIETGTDIWSLPAPCPPPFPTLKPRPPRPDSTSAPISLTP